MAAWTLRTGIPPSEWKALTLIERAQMKEEAAVLAAQIGK